MDWTIFLFIFIKLNNLKFIFSTALLLSLFIAVLAGFADSASNAASNSQSSTSQMPTSISHVSASTTTSMATSSTTSVKSVGTPTAKQSSVSVGPLLYQASSVRATQSQINQGKVLFIENCSSCHGIDASGSVRAPNLVGLGPATIQFWVTTGRMPLSNPIIQPIRKPSRFNSSQTLDIVAYVSSLGPGGILIPNMNGVNSASISDGASLFALNCAGCHTITGAGDALASGAYAPSLHQATPTQVAEAIRTGPANMPRFNSGNISDAHLNDIVKYVTQGIQRPNNAGGWGLGGVGPVAEGFIGLLIGVGLLVLASLWIGERD